MGVDDIIRHEKGLGYFGNSSERRARNQSEEELNRILEKVERLGITTLDTYSGLDRTAKDLGRTKESFTSLIKGKRICDIGSGKGGLAIECALENIDAEIVSVEPAIAHPNFKSSQLETLKEKLGGNYSQEQIQNAFDAYEQNAYAGSADELPFEDDFFDIAIDNRSVTFYSAKIGRELFKKSLQEMLRIIKPKGKLLIGDAVHFLDSEDGGFQMGVIEDLGLSYEFIYKLGDKEKHKLPIGIVIAK
ncbi:hypothetical protein A2Z22_00875 [Candidatus Woesebacteria bacterium RBG_16_34_12]|uniref:Methyltransferase type 11 domain-containing protein n=1 Tax=Candidatus Woesebacteria bacterium RBG_16_34_12 TaxID=1802480 RepID=A0A1F7XAL6_9BACT|nr:MAG: hypothetical protein A2Z22_00875 [Candidatus Woesebacteria bacterium RBG_16_34_12]